MFVALRLVSTLISIYMIVLVVRIVLTWFSGVSYHGKPFEILARITDPYLNFFRRFGWLRFGNVDFSPVAAILVVSIVGNILNSVAFLGVISLGIVLAIIVGAIASAVGFFLILFLALAIVRLVGTFANFNTANRFWLTIDHIVEPIVYRFTQKLFGGRSVSYQNGLLVFGGVDLAVILIGNFLIGQLTMLLVRLPV
ncbi:MAG TPA: YggT family protein [Spirochaetia bacterium]|nr:YggT family protein [Spirochaetia bacterium]